MCHCGLKSNERIWKQTSQSCPFLRAFLHTLCKKEMAWSLCISIKNHDTHTETDKFIYKALTLHDKEFLLNVIDSEAIKVPHIFRVVFLAKLC